MHPRYRKLIKHLSPADFAMVMATGIVSIAAYSVHYNFIAKSLFFLNNALYLLIWLLTILRLCFYPRQLWADLDSHANGLGFLSLVAATNVLAVQYVLLYQNHYVATILWVLGIIWWVILTYLIFSLLTIKEKKPNLAQGINGAWLLAIVATQSIAILTTFILPYFSAEYHTELSFFAISMWLWGGMQYIWMMTLIFWRYNFVHMGPGELTPPYWINMGAMAISTLAGSLLIQHAPDAPYLQSLMPFLKGFTVFFWASATWWIPLLLILGFWRHFIKRYPVRYTPLFWGLVFPLGMYSVATRQLNLAMQFDFLDSLAQTFMYAALVSWVITFYGLLHKAAHWLKPQGEKQHQRH